MRVLIFLSLALACSAMKSYEGYKVYRFTPNAESDKLKLDQLIETFSSSLDFWHEPRNYGDNADIMVAPENQKLVETFFTRKNMNFDIVVEDVEASLITPSPSFYTPGVLATFDYNIYHRLGEIESWVNDFSAAYSFVDAVVMGNSFEGRELVGLKFSTGIVARRPVFFQGGIHAREWISPATMINIARQFAEEYEAGNADVVSILNNYDVYILPVLNADGYEFSHTDDRMWRKNRNTNDDRLCTGVDLNRNYNVYHGGDGATNRKCDSTYHGPNALSEPETSTTNDFYQATSSSFGGPVAFIDFHSYGQYWMWPWGYSVGLPPTNDAAEQEAAATAGADALKAVHKTRYTLQASAAMYAAAGATEDYGYATLKAKYSYCVELPPKSSTVGFELPESEIQGVGEETFAGVVGFLQYIINNDLESVANPGTPPAP